MSYGVLSGWLACLFLVCEYLQARLFYSVHSEPAPNESSGQLRDLTPSPLLLPTMVRSLQPSKSLQIHFGPSTASGPQGLLQPLQNEV